MTRPRLHPTYEQRKLVKTLAAIGFKRDQIAAEIGIRSTKTLRKYFPKELDHGDLEGYAKVQQTHFQMATDGKHWLATKAWQESYLRRHGQGPDQGGPVSPSEKREVVWRTAEQLKPAAPPEPAKLASPQPTEPAPVASDFWASDEFEKQQTEAESPTAITLQAEPVKEKAET
jgi:hypothetical protein